MSEPSKVIVEKHAMRNDTNSFDFMRWLPIAVLLLSASCAQEPTESRKAVVVDEWMEKMKAAKKENDEWLASHPPLKNGTAEPIKIPTQPSRAHYYSRPVAREGFVDVMTRTLRSDFETYVIFRPISTLGSDVMVKKPITLFLTDGTHQAKPAILHGYDSVIDDYGNEHQFILDRWIDAR